MLKVVGASWYKTKISSCIVFSALLLSLGALFTINSERVEFESLYCATAYWSHSYGYRLEFWGQGAEMEEIPKGVARICYQDGVSEQGWPLMEIETNPYYPDKIQAFAAGILEGALTWKSIYDRWTLTVENRCDGEGTEEMCEWLRGTLNENYKNLKKQFESLKNNHSDHYLHQIYLYYQQLEGISFGWKIGVKRSAFKRAGLEIPFEDYLLMNAVGDMRELTNYYKKYVAKTQPSDDLSINSNILLKFLDKEKNKLGLSFTTPQLDDSPFRILKKYKFNFHLSGHKSKQFSIVPGHNVVFTSYSGLISSTDEFYSVNSPQNQITISGINTKYNSSMDFEKDFDFSNSICLGARVMAANRLATNAKTWTKIMTKNPGSGSKQWLLVNKNELKHRTPAPSAPKRLAKIGNEIKVDVPEVKIVPKFTESSERNNVIWVVDQVPGRLHGEDVTERFLDKSKIELNGVPFFDEMYKLSGIQEINFGIPNPKIILEFTATVGEKSITEGILVSKPSANSYKVSKNEAIHEFWRF